MIPLIAGWLAKSALMQSPVGKAVKAIPPRVWLYIAIAGALLAGFLWHQAHARHAISEAYAAGAKDENARLAKRALELKAKTDALTFNISKLERSRFDAEHNRISHAADALRVRGPGLAVCPSNASPAPAAGGHETIIGTGGNAVDRLPEHERQQLIALPFADTVSVVEQCDINRAEAQSWRSWYDALAKAWPR